MNIRVYIAAPFDCKPQAKETRKQLVEAGYLVTSRWIDLPDDTEGKPEEYFVKNAYADVEDILNSQILLILNIHKSEGKAVEQGMAIAWNIPIIVVGERSNIFHYLQIPFVKDVPEALALMNKWVDDYTKQLENNRTQESLEAILEQE